MSIVIEARELWKRYVLHHNRPLSIKERALDLVGLRKHQTTTEEFWALRDISLSISAGEAVGIVGRNGLGKSTFLKLVAGILVPTGGHLFVARGARIVSMIELGVGFHLELTGRENVFMNASIHGMSREEIEDIYPRVVEFAGLEHFMDVPLMNYSSGMHTRLGFAVAANIEPDILLLDEILAVGDEAFQKRCFATIERLLEQKKTILFVSHQSESVARICRRVCVLDRGALRYDGDVKSGLREYHGLMDEVERDGGWAAGA